MNRSTNVVHHACLAAGIAGLTIACGGADADTPAGLTGEPAAEFQYRLVDRQYPYAIGDGGLVCADWQIVSPAGSIVGNRLEWYPVKTMNRHLANVGTASAVAHIDTAFRDALLERGVTRIETCEQARAYVQLANERAKGVAPEELELPP